jgi:chromosome segregation ATPase
MNLPEADKQLLPLLDNNILNLIEIKNQVIKDMEVKCNGAYHAKGQMEGEILKINNNFDNLNRRYASINNDLKDTKTKLEVSQTTIKDLQNQISELKKLDIVKVNELNKNLIEQNKKLLQEKEQIKKSYDETKKELNELIEVQDNRTRNKKIKQYIRDYGNEDGYISFDGDDYCKKCPGWDGFSSRCECGNRRMDWYDEDGEFYPEPY